jgi:8-oxo-dGTP pyrophosphatase MutT (NUDIX family)
MKPRIFIGSSSEGRTIALAVQANLQPKNECVVWDQDIFTLSKGNLENLVDHIVEYDFGIFIISPDDKLGHRGNSYLVPRDNVIFEIGLFMGHLGRKRTFVVSPTDVPDLHLPSDLLGVSTAKFSTNRSDKRWKSELAPACGTIQDCIDVTGLVPNRALVDASGSAVDYVAAICYQIVDGAIEILLVNSTRNNRIFPKGKIRYKEEPVVAAMRYANTEGGVHTRSTGAEPYTFKYFKEEEGEEHVVAAFIFMADTRVHNRTKFRNPTWFTIDEARSVLIKPRSFPYTQELDKVISWANSQIKQLMIPRRQAGVVPFRKTKSGYEVMFVTSKTNKNWIFPKGNISDGLSTKLTAIKEADEEAGVSGQIIGKALGQYRYIRYGVLYTVDMYAMKVDEEKDDWPERPERRRQWVSIKHAPNFSDYDHVKQVLLDFSKAIM